MFRLGLNIQCQWFLFLLSYVPTDLLLLVLPLPPLQNGSKKEQNTTFLYHSLYRVSFLERFTRKTNFCFWHPAYDLPVLHPECWDYRCVPPCLASFVFGGIVKLWCLKAEFMYVAAEMLIKSKIKT